MTSRAGLMLVALAIVVIAAFLWIARVGAVNEARGRVAERRGASVPDRAILQSSGGYPGGGTPAPVATQTEIATGLRMFEGMTGEQIAEVIIDRYEEWGEAVPPTRFVAAAVVAPEDAGGLGLTAEQIAFQSPDDVAVILSGSFLYTGPGAYATPFTPSPYILVLVDTYSGAERLSQMESDLHILIEMLP